MYSEVIQSLTVYYSDTEGTFNIFTFTSHVQDIKKIVFHPLAQWPQPLKRIDVLHKFIKYTTPDCQALPLASK